MPAFFSSAFCYSGCHFAHWYSQRFSAKRDQRIFQSEHTISLLQTLGAWIQGQLREVLYQPVPVNRPSRDGPIELGSSTNCENHASKTLETQKKSYVDIEFMYIDCNSDEACHSAPELLEEPTVVMERALILARDARAGCLHGLQRFSMGNCSGPPLLLRNMESTTCEDAHKCKRATDGALCAEAQECDGCISFSLFRQHNHPLLQQKSGKIFQLILGHQITGYECAGLQLVRVHHPKRMPTLKSNIPGDPEGPQRMTHDHTSNFNVEVSNMVPGSDRTLCRSTVATSSKSSDSGPKKRKVAALGKQAMDLDGLEDQRRFVETQGHGTYAIDFIVFKKLLSRSIYRYSSIQQRFLGWQISKEISTSISAPQIINYLVEI
ncbi:hypothetical protein AYI69_g9167 [Smittium culicis]|uniref:Uncharacterized protein n=1 Tax=Smittium culicis TaxID=133412 RepID=A0A1R1XEG0_9FUNG|nr:hypothetical protein AYI69_g9167 [Smittium culicis]